MTLLADRMCPEETFCYGVAHLLQMTCVKRKVDFKPVRNVQIPIRLHACTVSSRHPLPTVYSLHVQLFCKRLVKFLNRQRGYAGWPKSSLCAHAPHIAFARDIISYVIIQQNRTKQNKLANSL